MCSLFFLQIISFCTVFSTHSNIYILYTYIYRSSSFFPSSLLLFLHPMAFKHIKTYIPICIWKWSRWLCTRCVLEKSQHLYLWAHTFYVCNSYKFLFFYFFFFPFFCSLFLSVPLPMILHNNSTNKTVKKWNKKKKKDKNFSFCRFLLFLWILLRICMVCYTYFCGNIICRTNRS